jgi:tetratricopeptide (TPR) repeat protein
MRLCHELKGMIAYAEQDFSTALQDWQLSNLQNPYNLYRIGMAYSGLKDTARAEEYYTQAKNFNALNNINYAFVRNRIK